MSSRKKRKLDSSPGSPQLSAIAARRALTTTQKSPQNLKKANADLDSTPRDKISDGDIINGGTLTYELLEASGHVNLQAASEDNSDCPKTVASHSLSSLEGDQDISLESRAETPKHPDAQPAVTFSTLRPNNTNVREVSEGIISLKLSPGERLVILGQYEIIVQKGRVTLLGSTLSKTTGTQRIYAPSSHSLPIIRCLATVTDGSEIWLSQYEDGLSHLRDLTPLFGKLWNDGSGPLGPEYSRLLQECKKSTFQILFSSQDTSQSYLQPLVTPPEWSQCLSNLADFDRAMTKTVMVCGPKSSGKSTFTKLLVNKLLSSTGEGSLSNTLESPGVALLDLDPGQPEYSTPGQVSLTHIRDLNFGPPFSHPVSGANSRLIRAHTIGAVSPSMEPDLYMSCSLNLFEHYRNLCSTLPKLPLVINTPGWVLGTGLEILATLIKEVRPHVILYMSQDGPQAVVEALKDAAKSTPLLTLPSQTSEYTTRTSAHLRTMQNVSYFHLNPCKEEKPSWSGLPLTAMPPWEVSYSGESASIQGIMCYGEQPPPELLAETINGCILAIIVIDDHAAIAEGSAGDQELLEATTLEDNGSEYSSSTTGDRASKLASNFIVRTSVEDLPYFISRSRAISLDPKYSHCIGICLVRGIDVVRRRLQLLTPISTSIIEEIDEAGKPIVLVSGKFDTPGWAYTEDLVRASAIGKSAEKEGRLTADTEDNDFSNMGTQHRQWFGNARDIAFENAPWIQKLEGSQGRGIGSRVWRVRRDLGKYGDAHE